MTAVTEGVWGSYVDGRAAFDASTPTFATIDPATGQPSA